MSKSSNQRDTFNGKGFSEGVLLIVLLLLLIFGSTSIENLTDVPGD